MITAKYAAGNEEYRLYSHHIESNDSCSTSWEYLKTLQECSNKSQKACRHQMGPIISSPLKKGITCGLKSKIIPNSNIQISFKTRTCKRFKNLNEILEQLNNEIISKPIFTKIYIGFKKSKWNVNTFKWSTRIISGNMLQQIKKLCTKK